MKKKHLYFLINREENYDKGIREIALTTVALWQKQVTKPSFRVIPLVNNFIAVSSHLAQKLKMFALQFSQIIHGALHFLLFI